MIQAKMLFGKTAEFRSLEATPSVGDVVHGPHEDQRPWRVIGIVRRTDTAIIRCELLTSPARLIGDAVMPLRS